MVDVTRDAESVDLEAALIARGHGGADDPGAFEAWLRHEGVNTTLVCGGRTPSVPTVEAFVLYRRWVESVGAIPVPPYEFARLMLGRFDKRRTSITTDRRRVTACYLLPDRVAKRLRAQAADHPPTPADRALFTFRALREARHPSRKET